MNRALLCLLLVASAPVLAARLDARPGQLLQPLLDRAAPGDEVHLPAGTYAGGLIIRQSLRLTGAPGAVIDGGGEGDAIRVQAPEVTIEGLTLRNWGRDIGASRAGIFLEAEARGARVLGNQLSGIAFGIWVEAPESRVARNRIQGDPDVRSQDRGNGIHLYNVQNVEVLDNEVWNARDGVFINLSNNNLIRGNDLHDLRYGVHYMYAMGNRLENNRTRRTRTGYALMQSKLLTVSGNVSFEDENYGLLLNNITNSTLRGNRVIDVRSGGTGQGDLEIAGAEGKAAFVYNSQYNEFSGNLFEASDIGIHLTAGSEDNRIFGNAFVGNYTQVKYVATREQDWSHEGRGNYWSDYLGWDLDGDGVGDTAYLPNDGIDRLLWRHPQAKILMHSPAVQTLRWAQQQFPVFRPSGVKDSAPLMASPVPASPERGGGSG